MRNEAGRDLTLKIDTKRPPHRVRDPRQGYRAVGRVSNPSAPSVVVGQSVSRISGISGNAKSGMVLAFRDGICVYNVTVLNVNLIATMAVDSWCGAERLSHCGSHTTISPAGT